LEKDENNKSEYYSSFDHPFYAGCIYCNVLYIYKSTYIAGARQD
jgi:hypothetical protein